VLYCIGVGENDLLKCQRRENDQRKGGKLGEKAIIIEKFLAFICENLRRRRWLQVYVRRAQGRQKVGPFFFIKIFQSSPTIVGNLVNVNKCVKETLELLGEKPWSSG
jgi:hypothetical protein